MANMSIVKSKRGVWKAAGVTKLIELTFFFISLTFTASISSIQMKESSVLDIIITVFISPVVVITVLRYALCLLIRSQPFIKRHGWLREVRADANLPPGAPIPSSTYLLRLWPRIESWHFSLYSL